MKNLMIASLFFVAGLSFADGHTDSEKDVLDALSAYFDARNDQNWKEAVKYESKGGTYNTNSDGSFHKPLIKQTAASWAASNQGGALNIYYPEAVELSKDVVFVRF